MRDYIEAYLRGLLAALCVLACAPPIVGLALIGLWLHRESYQPPGSGMQIHTPISDQWMWIVGLTLVVGWLIAAAQLGDGWDFRDVIAGQEALILGAIGFSAVLSVLSWLVFWIAVVAFTFIGLPATYLGQRVRRIRNERYERIAAQEREHGLQ